MTNDEVIKKAWAMKNTEFYAAQPDGYQWSKEFYQLSNIERREIIAGKLGLTWETYAAMPVSARMAATLAEGGMTYMSGMDTGIAAAQADARFDKIRGFISGLKMGSTVLIIGLAAAALFFFKAPLLRALKKPLKGAA